MIPTCCDRQRAHSYGKLLVKMVTFQLGISAVPPLSLEDCPNNRVTPNDFLALLITAKVGGHLPTLRKCQRPIFCPKIVKEDGLPNL